MADVRQSQRVNAYFQTETGYATIGKDKEGRILSFRGYDERMIGSRLRPLAQKSLPFSYEKIIKEINAYKEGE